MNARPILLLASLAAVYSFAGCGGGGNDSSAPAPATIAPPNTSVFVEATLRPRGSVKSDVESLVRNVAGIDDIGGKIVAELEKSATEDGEPIDFAKEVEPWLGEKAGLFLGGFDGEDFSSTGVAIQVTDTEEAQKFIDKHAKPGSGEHFEDFAHEGIGYKASSDGTSIGTVGDFIVVTKGQEAFKNVIDTSFGESMADKERYSEAIAAMPSGSLADVYVDIGGLIEGAGPIDPQAELFLQSAGIEPGEATATAGVIPGSDQIEIDVSTDVTGENPPTGDASDLLGSLPGESLVAFVSPEFGKSLGGAIDQLDAGGIPGQVPPHQLKEALKNAGIDLDQAAGSVGDLGVYLEDHIKSKGGPDGAVVLTTDNANQAKNTVSSIGLLLRASHTPGVTAIGGKASGFSIPSSELGRKPIVVAAEGERIVVGYGLPATLRVLSVHDPTLSSTRAYKDAVSALDGTPITGFVEGPGTLKFVESLVPKSATGFQEAKPYLAHAGFIAVGGGTADGRATAKLIVSFKY